MIKFILIFLIIILVYYIYIDIIYRKKYKETFLNYNDDDEEEEEENLEKKVFHMNKNGYKLYYYDYDDSESQYQLYDEPLRQNGICKIKLDNDHNIFMVNKDEDEDDIPIKSNGYSLYRINNDSILHTTKDKFIKLDLGNSKHILYFVYDEDRNILVINNENKNVGYIMDNKKKILIADKYIPYINVIMLGLLISIYN